MIAQNEKNVQDKLANKPEILDILMGYLHIFVKLTVNQFIPSDIVIVIVTVLRISLIKFKKFLIFSSLLSPNKRC